MMRTSLCIINEASSRSCEYGTHSCTVYHIMYTGDAVRASLLPKWNTYYDKLAVGQAPTWKCDQRTVELFCLSQWLIDELTKIGCPDEDRRDVQNFFNRKARAEDDLYWTAARAMNTFLEGKIERVRRRPIT